MKEQKGGYTGVRERASHCRASVEMVYAVRFAGIQGALGVAERGSALPSYPWLVLTDHRIGFGSKRERYTITWRRFLILNLKRRLRSFSLKSVACTVRIKIQNGPGLRVKLNIPPVKDEIALGQLSHPPAC